MSKLSEDHATVGVELEWADVNRRDELPSHLGKWSEEDYSIVNSDGHANCPHGCCWQWGGEINTRPTATAQEQGDICAELAEHLGARGPAPTINYKCNLHVHVRHPLFQRMLDGDVGLLISFASRLREAEDFVYSAVEPIVKPTEAEFPDPLELRGAMKRYRRNLTSHHYRLPDARWTELVHAGVPDGVRLAHAPPTAAGGRAFHVAPRPGMNLRSLWKHGTLELRHFPGTADPVEVTSACRWGMLFVEEMMRLAQSADSILVRSGEAAARRIYKDFGPWRFPQFRRYDHALQLGFDATKWK